MSKESEVFLIELKYIDGRIGYLIDVKDGEPVTIVGIPSADVKLFPNFASASRFAYDNKFNELKYAKHYILSNIELVAKFQKMGSEEIHPAPKVMYRLVNQGGWFLFYSEVKKAYYFDNKSHFFCVWYDTAEAQEAVNYFSRKFKGMTISYEVVK